MVAATRSPTLLVSTSNLAGKVLWAALPRHRSVVIVGAATLAD